ncbi:hypothetical protein [Campylobacter sp.]|nr:hypothetical protein [Campylobacter sp.]
MLDSFSHTKHTILVKMLFLSSSCLALHLKWACASSLTHAKCVSFRSRSV